MFLGRDMGHRRDYSEEVAAAIDEEVRKLIEAAHTEAWEILAENRDVLDVLAVELLEKETLDKAEVARIFEPLNRRPVRPAWTGSSRRTPSERGPVQSPKEIARRRTARANGSANGSDATGRRRTPHRAPSAGTDADRTRPRERRLAASAASTRCTCRRRRDARRSTTPAPRPRSASCCSRSGRTPTATACCDTPARVARAYAEMFAGLRQTPEDVLATTFDLGHDEMVLVKDIEVYSTCEHHLVPFHGVAHVGYIPGDDGRITGLSKLARLVDVYAKRPQVQERLTTQVADALVRILRAARRHRRHRVRAPVHVDARRPQARRPHHHERRARAACATPATRAEAMSLIVGLSLAARSLTP